MDKVKEWLMNLGLSENVIAQGTKALELVALVILAYVAYLITKRIILQIIKSVVKRSKTEWDNYMMQRNVFGRLAHLAPALVIYILAPAVFGKDSELTSKVQLASGIYMVIVALLVGDALLNSFLDIYRTFSFAKRIPIRGILQVVKIVLFIIVGVVILSMIVGRSPLFFLGSMGAMTAVFLLIFKDAILGLVAVIQLTANDMVLIGDWIEMPKYGADGDVIDVSLTTVKVQNWDKTVSTIPAYSLISDSFKNWRGMEQSGGRRIKRAVYIDMSSIKFCTEEMLKKFKNFQHITEYIERKKKEIAEFNKVHEVDESELVNGRRLTNIGTLRAYLVAYLKNHPLINQNMTFLIRHLQPTEHGLPIEIYVFSKDKVWANYEAIQADIFDHILAVIPEFELRVFQNPTGADFRHLAKLS
jgi:miniconductance mechanosensitive channel